MRHVAIVGAGRLGTLLAAALSQTGVRVIGPLGHDPVVPAEAEAVLLCVPDAQIAAAAAATPAGPLLAHCSGATGLDVFGGRRGFSLHPLMTIAPGADPEILRGASAAIAGSDALALRLARDLAGALAMTPIQIAEADRAAYHAAASVAANFLVTVEAAAETIAATAGLPAEALHPLVRAAVENWASAGARAALTGPVARGDEVTVARQRDAVAGRTPQLLALFDALTEATRELAAGSSASEAVPC